MGRGRRPTLDDFMQLPQPVAERGRAGLQNVRRFYFVNMPVSQRRNTFPARSLRHLRRLEFFAAPGADNDIGLAAHHLLRVVDHAVAGEWRTRKFREAIHAAGNLNQFLYPTDAADEWIVPFLEIDPRLAREGARALFYRFHAGGQAIDQSCGVSL